MNTNLQTLTSLKANIDSQIIALQAQSVAIADAITLETNGYQSDQTAIATGIATGIATALAPITAAQASLTTAINTVLPA